MQVTPHVYRVHFDESPDDGGAMHPGGSNVYFVGDPEENMVVIDTGEHYRTWTRQILDYHASLGTPAISAILVTHGHGDHIGGVDRLQERMECPVRCHPQLTRRLERILGEEAVAELGPQEVVQTGGGVTLQALFTPGHEDDHVCYYMPQEQVMFTGDTILGGSSSTVRNLSDYMKSLEILAEHQPEIVCPGHGPIVTNGQSRVQYYITHRQERERQVLEALEQGMTTVDEMVSYIYPRDLRKELREGAARNVVTHLAKLKEEGRVSETLVSYALK